MGRCRLRHASVYLPGALVLVLSILLARLVGRGEAMEGSLPRRPRAHHSHVLHRRSPRQDASSGLPWSRFRAVTVIHEPCSTLAHTLTNFAGNLGPDWPLLVVYTPRAETAVLGNRMVRHLARYGDLATLALSALANIQGLSADLTHVAQYSRLLAHPAFWEAMQAEKVLMFQVDSVLCSGSDYSIDDFLAYDYIGAPWVHAGYIVGNGGLSLRSVDRMLDITRRFNRTSQPEDVFFVEGLANMARHDESVVRAPSSVAETFSWEMDNKPPDFVPFGIHRSVIVPAETKDIIIRGCPEAAIGVWSSCGRSGGALLRFDSSKERAE